MANQRTKPKASRFGPKNARERASYAEEAFRFDWQQRLREAMCARYLSNRQLARKLGMPTAKVTALFGPKANPTLRLLVKALHVCGAQLEIEVR